MPDNPDWLHRPEWGVALTVAAYALALLLRARFKWMHPLFFGSIAVIAVLALADIPYELYRHGADYVLLLLGPATVALGVPIYKYSRQLRRSIAPIAAGVIGGSIVSLAVTWLLVRALGLSDQLLYALLPKSVTTAVSAALTEQLGGMPEMSAAFTVLTGLVGSMFGPLFLRLIGVRGDAAIGTAVGTAAHGIGTARLVGDSERQAGVSALAMSLSCLVTPALMIPLYSWLA